MSDVAPLVIVVMGVSGVGKSVVGALLAQRLGWEFADADDFHCPQNVAKMTTGQPLSDADRAPWLALIAQWIREHVATQRPGVMACSGLRRAYREQLGGDRVCQVLLVSDAATLRARLRGRRGHFMPASLLDSQLQTLELPQPDEDVLVIASSATPEDTVGEILRRLQLLLDS